MKIVREKTRGAIVGAYAPTWLLVLAFAAPGVAKAQLDTQVKPYVIMALDSSGSMLKKTSACTCTTPSCAECLPDCTTEFQTRWDAVTEALIGDFRDDGVNYRRSCTVTPRTDAATYTYDQGYILPDIRPIVLDSASVEVGVHNKREANGLITLNKDSIQFGIATFDSQPTTPGMAPSVPTGTTLENDPFGQFSYEIDRPFSFPGCLKPPHIWELGVVDGRSPYTGTSDATNGWTYTNPSTVYGGRLGPAGRWVSPGATNFYDEIVGWYMGGGVTACSTDAECIAAASHTRCNTSSGTCEKFVSGTLDDLRPFGPSPTAAMFDDLTDLIGVKEPSLVNDPQAGCRQRIMIFVTDGAPNADARGYPYFCENSAGSAGLDGDCPYLRPEEYISQFIAKGQLDAVFVIGLDVDADPAATDEVGVEARDALAAMGQAGSTAFFASSPALLDLFPELDPSDANYVGFLPTDAANLKGTISRVLDLLPQPVSSRSVPTFANVITSSGRIQAQFNTGYTVDGGRAGVVERVRYVCDLSGTPIPTFEGEEAGTNVDDFDALIDEQAMAGNRSVTTATPTAQPDARQTIGAPIITLATDMGGIGDDTTREACLERPCVDNASSRDVTLVGAADYGVADVAARNTVTDWIVGTCDRTTSFCPAIKDVYGSSPVFVTGEPTAASSDTAHALFTRKLSRPDTLYVNDNGGVIHAITANDWDGDENNTISTGTPEMSGYEMFSFLPPMLLEDAAKRSAGGSEPVMRATPVVKDINIYQPSLAAATGDEYRTVLLTGANSSRNDGYVALDVTDPASADEKFLWQFKPLDMGRTSGQPALGQVRLEDPGVEDYTRGVAILPGGAASASTGTTLHADVHSSSWIGGVVDGMNANAVAGPPAVPYVDWDLGGTKRYANGARRSWPIHDGASGRGLWVVDVGSGRTIRKFGLNADAGCYGTPATPPTVNGFGLADENHTDPNVCLHSPIVGSVALYPGVPGTLAQAAYVTDADGILWRVEMSDPDETNWKMEPIFDLFNTMSGEDINDGLNDGILTPQTVVGSPILSVNEVGEVIIMIGTGDVDNLTGTGITNRIVSLTEKLTFDGSRYVPTIRLNWQLSLQNEHVTGPMTLSGGILYFTTFESTKTANACGIGYGKICGAHYVTRAVEADPSYSGALAANDLNASQHSALHPLKVFNDGTTDVYCATLAENQVFGGVAVTRRPTCTDTTDPSDIDPYFCNGLPAGIGGCNNSGSTDLSGITGGETEIVAIGSTGGTTAVPKSSIAQTTSGAAREDRQITVLSWSGTAY